MFASLPVGEPLQITWPTPNNTLFEAPERFFARTRVNADYGKPGWTRDCGKRLHRGCDIAPVSVTATGKTTRVVFTDCATGRDFESEEPTFVPHDEVFCVCEGIVHEVVTDESQSDFGKHVVIEHRWPLSGQQFFTLYAHLSELALSSQLSARGNGLGQWARRRAAPVRAIGWPSRHICTSRCATPPASLTIPSSS